VKLWIQALSVLLPVAYLGAAVLCGMAFAGPRQPSISRLRGAAVHGVLALHVAYFALQGRASASFPVAGTWLVLSAVALATTLLFAGITWRAPQPSVGSIVLLLVTALQLCASAFGPLQPLAAGPADAFRILHVSTTVVASAALVLSGVYGFLHILLYRQMRARRFGPLFQQLPDLEQLARSLRRAALAGFLLLTVGLNLGIAMAHQLDVRGFHYRDPHVLLTLLLWVHFGVIAFSRRIRGFSARRASFAAAAGLVTLLAILFLTLVPRFTFHAFG